MRLKLSLKYIISISIVLITVLGLLFLFLLKKHEDMIITQLEMQAKALFKQVIITRRWIAEHGGVFVEKLPWVDPNPYLPDATITDVRGKRYVKENPAMVTKQLSRYAEHENLYMFHITSLKLMNPANKPDEFETRSLQEFENGTVREASAVEEIGGTHYYRYIAPLYVEKACLDCHGKQGYKVGDVRGAISVSIPMSYALSVISEERRYMIAGMIVVSMFLVAALFLITRRIVIAPIARIKARMTEFSRKGVLETVTVAHGDEIEDLNTAFHQMARSVQDYQSCLEEKIRAATGELVEKNDALVKSHRSKADFIAKTSHELRTPLTSIKGAMDYLSVKLSMRESGEDRDLQIFFEMVKKNVDRMIRLLNNILDYERIELGTFEMHFKTANLKEVFREVITGFIPAAEEKQVQIRMKAMDVTAFVDEDRMKQVLINLLSNAFAFSPPQSKVLVFLECRNDVVRVAVEDRGCGVPDGDREMIFRQFYSKAVKEGTGLGLAICKGIIEAHGGEIGCQKVESGGSRFWFAIPQVPKEAKPDEKKTPCRR